MLKFLIFFFALTLQICSANGVVQNETLSTTAFANLLFGVITAGIVFDWLQIKFVPLLKTMESGEELKEELVFSEAETKETSTPKSFESSKQDQDPKENKECNKICEPNNEGEELKEVHKQEDEKDDTEENFLKLQVSSPVSVDIHPEPSKYRSSEEEEEEDLKSIPVEFAPPGFSRPRFNSDPTGKGGELWSTPIPEEQRIVGERSPNRSPELVPPAALLEENDIPEIQEPGCGIPEEWPEEKVNERKPMVFIGGVSASTSPMEVVAELKSQGFNVAVVPRIRYGVSFGFCPDLVLSSDYEVSRILSMGRVWIKDRWIDVRPYIPKEEEESNDDSKTSETACDSENDGKSEIEQEEEQTRPELEDNVQEVNEKVFEETRGLSLTPSPRDQEQEQPQMFFPYHQAYTPGLNPEEYPQIYGGYVSSPVMVPWYVTPEYVYGDGTPCTQNPYQQQMFVPVISSPPPQ